MEPVVKIKEVIENLSQIFNLHGFPKITAEHFRKAKFNKTEASYPIMNLIYEIITLNGKTQCTLDQKFFLFLRTLKKLNYPRLFVFVFSDIENISSRELLVVFGFLVVKLDVLSYLRDKTFNDLSEEVLMKCSSKKTNTLTEEENFDVSFESKLNEFIVLRKKIDFAFCGVYSVLDMHENLLKKYNVNEDLILKELNTNSYKVRFKHIALVEVLIQRNLKLQEDLVSTIRKQQKLTKLHLKWLQNENMFWEWMTSVSNENQSSTSNQLNLSKILEKDRIMLSLLVAEDPIFQKIRRHFVYSDDNASLVDFKDCSLRTYLLYTMTKHSRIFDESDNDIDSVYIDEIRKLEAQKHVSEEKNKIWLSKFLSQTFPGLIELPVPRR